MTVDEKIIEKTFIRVDENDVIVKVTGAVTKKGHIPWSRFMAMKRDGALVGVQDKDTDKWTNTIVEEFIDTTYVEILRDHTANTRTVELFATGETVVVPNELELALELRQSLNKRIKELRKAKK